MKIELNIHHTCTSVVEFTKLSTAIAALLSEFSAGVVTSAPLVAPTVSRNDVTNPVPPAPVTRTADTTAPITVADVAAPAETSNLPAAFSAALAEPPKRKRRTKAEMAAAAAASGGVADAGADDDGAEETRTPPVIAAKAPVPVVDIFAAPTAPAVTPAAVTATPAVMTQAPTPPLTTSAESRASLKSMMLGLFMKEGGEAKVEQILQKFGGSISNIPDDKIGACAVELNAALHG